MNVVLDQLCKYLWNCSRENKSKEQSRKTISLVMRMHIPGTSLMQIHIFFSLFLCFFPVWALPIRNRLHTYEFYTHFPPVLTDTSTDVAIKKKSSDCVLVWKRHRGHILFVNSRDKTTRWYIKIAPTKCSSLHKWCTGKNESAGVYLKQSGKKQDWSASNACQAFVQIIIQQLD